MDAIADVARKMQALSLWALLAGLAGTIATAASADSSEPGLLELKSSVMWQPRAEGESFVYPPGIPAVLRRSTAHREFRIEQYYSEDLGAAHLLPRVRGTWPDFPGLELRQDSQSGAWFNQYVTITRPVCSPAASVHGHRCVTSLQFSADVPTGVVGISLTMVRRGEEFTHPNSVFLVIVPDEGELAEHVTKSDEGPDAVGSVRSEFSSAMPLVVSPRLMPIVAEVARSVVNIKLDGSFSLGSGFFVRNVQPLLRLFPPHVGNHLQSMPSGGIFIVTAAHLFPVPYSDPGIHDSAIDMSAGTFAVPGLKNHMFNLQINETDVERAAELIARSMEDDVAILWVSPANATRIARAMGVSSLNELQGLRFANELQPDSRLHILGYPADAQGELVHRVGWLTAANSHTEDTSNFGALPKFKVESFSLDGVEIARAGMSGGPIIDSNGRVVGISSERPNDSNSLIGINLTLVGATRVPPRDDLSCAVRFNPFDRVLVLLNLRDDCDYGSFGSSRKFKSLRGRMVFQEILGFGSEEDDVG